MIAGTIVSVGPEFILIDIGRKIEGALPVAKWQETRRQAEPKVGDEHRRKCGAAQ